jgi:divalent metal cation (Fe/Co/Zn/Cd) transporter
MSVAEPEPNVLRRVLRIQVFTIVWMSVEAAVSLGAAWTSRSPALLAFGGDSAVEFLSAAVVYSRFRFNSSPSLTEKSAARIAGGLLFILAAYVALVSVLSLLGYREAQPSMIGIILLVTAALVMPWLAKQKRILAILTSSASLKADAMESALCGYLAWIALAGLATNAIWGKSWADPIAALSLTPLIIREGWDAVKNNRSKCC